MSASGLQNSVNAARDQRHRGNGIRDINAEWNAKLSGLEKMAVVIAATVGTPGFFLIIAIWTLGWVLWNIYAPAAYRVDKGMEFAVWIFVSNVLQILLMPLLLIAQNLQTRHDSMRADNDFQETKKSRQEIESVLGHLYTLNHNLGVVMEKLGIADQGVNMNEKVPDLCEEEFEKRQRELLDDMARKLAQTHELATRAAAEITTQVNTPKPPRRLPK